MYRLIPLKYTIDGETYTDMYGLTAKEFFAKLRERERWLTTSQMNPAEAKAALEPFLKEGKDVLHLGIFVRFQRNLQQHEVWPRRDAAGRIPGREDLS